MDEDFQSFIVDPNLVDEGIDVSGLKTQTSTRPELLFDLPEFSGIKVDPTRDRYIRDMYQAYGGGLPMLPEPVVETPVVTTPIVDTSVMDQPAGDSILDTTPTNTQFEQNLLDQGIGVQGSLPDPVVAPGEMPLTQDDFDDFNKIAVTPVTPVDTSIAIEDFTTPFVTERGITGGPVEYRDQTGTIGGAPDVFDINQTGDPTTTMLDVPTDTVGLAYTGEFDPADEGTVFDTSGLTGATTEQRNTIKNILNKAGQTVDNALDQLSRVPGAVVDFTNQTVDILGQKINVGKTLASAAANKIVGGPISLVFDAVGGLPSGISETTNKAREVGLLIGDTTVTQDKYGINTQSALGDYDKYNIERVEFLENKINKTPRDIQELQERTNYVNQRADIDKDPTGDAQIAEETIGTLPEITEARQKQGEQIQEIQQQEVVQSGSDEADRQQRDTGVAKVAEDRYETKSGDVYASAEEAAEKSDGGDSGGGKSIVCTAMYQTTGLEDWKKAMKIWYIYQKKYLTIQHQEGYHKLFKPFVKGMHKSSIIKAIGAHVARHRTQHLKHVMFNSKPSLLGKIYNKILEPICYFVGKHG